MTFVSGAVLTASELNSFAPGNHIRNSAGSYTTPSYSFVDDPNTGLWSAGVDEIAVSAAGYEVFRIGRGGNSGALRSTRCRRRICGGVVPCPCERRRRVLPSCHKRREVHEHRGADDGGGGQRIHLKRK